MKEQRFKERTRDSKWTTESHRRRHSGTPYSAQRRLAAGARTQGSVTCCPRPAALGRHWLNLDPSQAWPGQGGSSGQIRECPLRHTPLLTLEAPCSSRGTWGSAVCVAGWLCEHFGDTLALQIQWETQAMVMANIYIGLTLHQAQM